DLGEERTAPVSPAIEGDIGIALAAAEHQQALAPCPHYVERLPLHAREGARLGGFGPDEAGGGPDGRRSAGGRFVLGNIDDGEGRRNASERGGADGDGVGH